MDIQAFFGTYLPFVTIPLGFIFLEQAVSARKRRKPLTAQIVYWSLFGIAALGTLTWAIMKFV